MLKIISFVEWLSCHDNFIWIFHAFIHNNMNLADIDFIKNPICNFLHLPFSFKLP